MTEELKSPCDICGKSLASHNMGHGVPMCGIYPVYRPRSPTPLDEVVKALVDFVQTPDWQPDAVEPEDSADWRDGYEAAQENLREVLKPWWPFGGPLNLAAPPPAHPAQDESEIDALGEAAIAAIARSQQIMGTIDPAWGDLA